MAGPPPIVVIAEAAPCRREQRFSTETSSGLARSPSRRLVEPQASEADKEDARGVMSATRVDRTPLLVGLTVLAVLIALFIWVYARAHAG